MVTMKGSIVVALFTLLPHVSCQVTEIGGCPLVRVLDKFDPNKFSGKWFEVERTHRRGLPRLSCVAAEYYYDGQGKFSTANTAVLPNGHLNRVLGELSITNQTEPAKMTMRFLAQNPEQRPFWVLYADYENCSIVYRCLQLFWLHTKYAWILCRNHTSTETYLVNMRSYVQQWTGINPQLFSKTPCK